MTAPLILHAISDDERVVPSEATEEMLCGLSEARDEGRDWSYAYKECLHYAPPSRTVTVTVEEIARAMADYIGHGMSEKCEKHAQACIAYLASRMEQAKGEKNG